MTGTIFLESAELSVRENAGFAYVPIVRTGDLSGAVQIEYGVTPGTATAGSDYTNSSGFVTLQPGQDRVLVEVPLIDDSRSEATESFAVSIIAVDSGRLLFPRTAQVGILDNENPVTDPPNPPLSSEFDVTEVTLTSDVQRPIAFEFLPNDSSKVLIAEQGGRIKVLDLDSGQFQDDFVDIRDKVNENNDRGLLDIELHPDFPQEPYVYAFYVVDPPQTEGQFGNAGPDGAGNRFAYLVRFTADESTGYQTIVEGSETILLGGAGQTLSDISGGGAINSTSNRTARASDIDPDTGGYREDYIKVDSQSHAGGSIAFGPDGALYLSIGDGTSYNFADPRTVSVQSLDALAGKIVRIDPLTGRGLADNPFVEPGVDLDSNRAKVFQLGLRNPFSMGFDQDGNLFITDTGWTRQEEINTGGPGANFGWPYYEGGDNGVLLQTGGYRDLPEAGAFYAAVARGDIEVTAAYRSFSHTSSDPGFQVQAITGADGVITSDKLPAELKNHYIFTDIVQGEVFSVDTKDQRDVQFLYKARSGFGPAHIKEGPDGELYYVDVVGGSFGRLDVEGPPAGLTARVDDAYSLFINGEEVLTDGDWRDAEFLERVINPGDVIAVRAVDTGGAAGAFFDIRLPNGARIGSSSEWLVSETQQAGWTEADFDDSAWVNATEYGGPNADPWGPAFGAIAPFLPASSPGQWIWTDDNRGDNEVYFRFVVPGSPPPVNQAPVAAPDNFATDEDTAVIGNLLDDNGAQVDSDPDGDPLVVSAVNGVAAAVGNEITLASGALLTVNADGTFRYDPNGQFEDLNVGDSVSDSFTYTISDGRGGTDTTTATITVDGIGGGQNSAPVAALDYFSTDEDTEVTGNLLDYNGPQVDSDPDGDPLVVSAINGAAAAVGNEIALASGALLTVNADGTFRYDPSGRVDDLSVGDTVSDSFTYTISDGRGGTDTTTATVYVEGTGGSQNTAPVAAVDYFSTDEDTEVTGNLLDYNGPQVDSDPDGDPLVVSAINGAAAAVGNEIALASGALLTVNADGTFRYDPSGRVDDLSVGDTVSESFTYTISDGRGGTDTTTATVYVEGTGGSQNSAPVAALDYFSTDEDTEVNGNLVLSLTLVPMRYGSRSPAP